MSSKLVVVNKLQRQRRSVGESGTVAAAVSLDNFATLFKWYSICMAWWLAVMRRTDHPSQKLLRAYWNRIPFRQSVRIFQYACMLQQEKQRRGSPITAVIHIKRALLEEHEKWQDKDTLGQLEAAASKAIEYRLARSVCPATNCTLVAVDSTSRLFRNAMAVCKGFNLPEPVTARKFTAAAPPVKYPTTHGEKHRYKNIDWMPFPVRCIVLHTDASIYASPIRYAGAWFRPNKKFFTDIERLPRTFGKLGTEPIFLGYVNALKPYGSLESVVPESLESFRREKKQNGPGRALLDATPEEIQVAARPFLYKLGLGHTQVGTLANAVDILAKASLNGTSGGTEEEAAAKSYYRGVLQHILCEGTKRKHTRPSLPYARNSLTTPQKPVFSSPWQKVRISKPKPMEVDDIYREPMLQQQQPPPPPDYQISHLQDMMARLRIQSIDPANLRCWSCSRPCSASILRTSDSREVQNYCSELCYTTTNFSQ